MKILYLCYFGLREPLVQTQVLPYLRQISKENIEVSLLTFEPDKQVLWPDGEVESWQSQLQDEGIEWRSLPYHKRPSLPATLYDIVRGAVFAARFARAGKADVLHARSHVPMAMALLARWPIGCRLVFDVRGLMAEEYADAGIWDQSSLRFRAIKILEKIGLKRADQVVVLTDRMRSWLVEGELAERQKIEVIPCCVDLSRFAEAAKELEGPNARDFEVVYAGSVTGLYLLEEMGRFFLAVRALRPRAFLKLFTSSPSEEAARTLVRAGLDRSEFWIGRVDPSEIPAHLCRARLGLSFRKPTFSQIAACPTKVPEYLAAGLPVVCNAGIGDLDDILEKSGVGVIVRSFDAREYEEAARRAIALAEQPGTRPRCTAVADELFDLVKVGGAGYLRLYKRLQEHKSAAPALAAML